MSQLLFYCIQQDYSKNVKWHSQSSDFEDCCLLRFKIMQFFTHIPTSVECATLSPRNRNWQSYIPQFNNSLWYTSSVS